MKKCNKRSYKKTLSQYPKERITHYIYKSFIRPNLDYSDFLYDTPEDGYFRRFLK